MRTGQAALETPTRTPTFEAWAPLGCGSFLRERKGRCRMGRCRTAEQNYPDMPGRKGISQRNTNINRLKRPKDNIPKVKERSLATYPEPMTVPLPSTVPVTVWQRPREHLQP